MKSARKAEVKIQQPMRNKILKNQFQDISGAAFKLGKTNFWIQYFNFMRKVFINIKLKTYYTKTIPL